MKFVISFVVCFGLVQCWAETKVKPIPTGNGRVVQGSPAVNGQFPHMVYFGGCGGSLIADKWVVTAAHCISTSRRTVRMGDVKFGLSPITRNIVRNHVHPEYNPPSLRHDIALLELDVPVPFSANVQPINIPKTTEDFYTDKIAQLSGFGAINDDNELPDVLQYADLMVVPQEECSKLGSTVINSTLCASGTKSPAQGGCFGDSGSGLTFKRVGLDFIIGIASFVVGSCESSFPTGFVRPYYYRDWIRKVTMLDL